LEKISEEDRQLVNIFKFSYGGGRLKEYTRKNPLFCRHEALHLQSVYSLYGGRGNDFGMK
jgi:hypothetical protein